MLAATGTLPKLMKTSFLIVTIAAGLVTASAAQAQDASFTAPGRNPRYRNAPTRLAPRTDGVVVRAVRSGHPLQMINPGAPTEYGNGQDTVRHEANDPYQRPQGIKLFVVEF